MNAVKVSKISLEDGQSISAIAGYLSAFSTREIDIPLGKIYNNLPITSHHITFETSEIFRIGGVIL
jgi:hypothetical protein